MKKATFVAALAALTSSGAMATTTFLFNAPFSGGMSSGLSNAGGVVATNGMAYGILIDTNGGGFASTTYDALTGVPAFGSTLKLLSGGLATDAILVMAPDLTGDQSFGGAFSDIGGGDPSVGGGVSGVTVTYGNGVVAGQTFALIWFNTAFNGTGTAGSLASNDFVLGADAGASINVDAVFVGPDPIRPATGITFVPEPSAALLGALGALGLLRRRRN